jgi:Amt family ammonium transporter
LAANKLAVSAFVVTNTAAAAAGLTWAILEWIRNGKPTVFGVVTGAVAGLATITPASGFVNPMAALLIGIFTSILCFIAIAEIKSKLGYDDSLDVFGVHGVGGIFGSLAVGLFASTAVNAGGANGLFFGNPRQFLIQLLGVAVAIVYTFIVTLVIYKFVDIFFGMRVKDEDEVMGLDLTQHHEQAYTMLE